MNAGLVVALVSLVLSLAAIVVSLVLGLRQASLMRHANFLPVALETFKRFNEPDFRKRVSWINTELWEEFPPDGHGTRDMPEVVRSQAMPVAAYFNMLGTYVAVGVVDKALVATLMGATILKTWHRVAPYIRNERGKRGDPVYYIHFEDLVRRVADLAGPEKLKGRLHLHNVDDSHQEILDVVERFRQ